MWDVSLTVVTVIGVVVALLGIAAVIYLLRGDD
jgi:hypothetical protein